MTTFDLHGDLNPGAWFTYEEKEVGEPDSQVKVRAYNNEVLKDIQDKWTKKKVEYKQPAKRGRYERFEVRESNDEKISEELWDYTIIDWEGFKDPSGAEIPCTRENKVLLMRRSPEFYAFIDKCLEQLLPDTSKDVEAAEKN